jgi:hypothetical protein
MNFPLLAGVLGSSKLEAAASIELDGTCIAHEFAYSDGNAAHELRIDTKRRS